MVTNRSKPNAGAGRRLGTLRVATIGMAVAYTVLACGVACIQLIVEHDRVAIVAFNVAWIVLSAREWFRLGIIRGRHSLMSSMPTIE